MKFSEPHLGKTVRKLAAERGMEQTAIGRRLGVSMNTIHKSLSQRNFRLYRIREFSQILGVDLFSYLLSEENKAILARGRSLEKSLGGRSGRERITELESEVERLKQELAEARAEATREKAQVELLRDIMKGRG